MAPRIVDLALAGDESMTGVAHERPCELQVDNRAPGLHELAWLLDIGAWMKPSGATDLATEVHGILTDLARRGPDIGPGNADQVYLLPGRVGKELIPLLFPHPCHGTGWTGGIQTGEGWRPGQLHDPPMGTALPRPKRASLEAGHPAEALARTRYVPSAMDRKKRGRGPGSKG